MMPPPDPKQWLASAFDDLRMMDAGRNLVPMPFGLVAFHAQQVVEKSLKAFLVSQAQVPEKTHDLVSLLSKCIAVRGEFSRLHKDCVIVAGSVASRYPDAPLPTQADVEQFIAVARRVYEFVDGKLS